MRCRTRLGWVIAVCAVVVLGACKPEPAARPPGNAATPTNDVVARPAAAAGASRVGPTAPPKTIAATALAVGMSHACAIVEDGSVRCWGSATGGALGNDVWEGDVEVPEVVRGVDDVRGVAADRYRTCVWRNDGSAWCWGEGLVFDRDGQTWSGGSGTPRAVPTLVDTVQVALGPLDACGLQRDGSARCWGDPSSSLRGHARATVDAPTFAMPLPASTTAMALGSAHACALDRSGAVHCWGGNDDGQLGVGDRKPRRKPARVGGLPTVRALAAFHTFTCAITSDGGLRCWGGLRCLPMDDCGIRDFSVTRPRTIESAEPLVSLVLGTHGGLVLDAKGHVWHFDPASALGASRGLRRVEGIADAVEVGVGMNPCARLRNGEVHCWSTLHPEAAPTRVALFAAP
jgi:alpha-tubulin suppressor-like RCC1 family protein